MVNVIIRGWRVGLRKVSMTQSLRAHCGLGLADAKAVTVRVLAGEVVEVQTPDSETARQLVAELAKLGANATVGQSAEAEHLERTAEGPFPSGGD